MFSNLLRKMRYWDESFFKAAVRTLRFHLFTINRFIIFEQDLTKEITKPSVEKLGYRIQIMDNEEWEAYDKKTQNPPREFSVHQTHGIKRCLLILKQDEIAHISWLFLKGDPSRCFDLGEEETQIDYSFTFPEHRGLGLNIQAHYAAALFLKGMGKRSMYGAVHETTVSQVKSLNKIVGFERIGTVSQWFVFRPKFKRVKPA